MEVSSAREAGAKARGCAPVSSAAVDAAILTLPSKEGPQPCNEPFNPPQAALLILLPTLQQFHSILCNTEPALNEVEIKLQAVQMRAHQLEAGSGATCGGRGGSAGALIHPIPYQRGSCTAG